MFLLFLKGRTCVIFRNPLELLVGLGALTGGIEEVNTVSPRLVRVRTFSGETLLISAVPPADLGPPLYLPLLPFPVKALGSDM
jgi:hypothetical protein